MFSKTTIPNSSNVYIDNSKLCKQSDRFDNDCQNARQQYINAPMHFNRMKSDENRVNMCSKRNIYKRLVRSKKRSFEMKQCKVIENLRHSKPKDFLKFFSKRKHVSNYINPEEFFNFFSAMQHDLLTNPDTGASSFCDSHNFNGTECNYDELDTPMSIDEIHVAIKRLKTNKAFGSDQLLNEYFD